MASKEFLRKLRQKYHLGEFRKNKTVKAKPRRTKRAKKRQRVFSMARRKRVSHRRGMLGGSGVSGLAKSALIGIGTAEFANFIPVSIPFKQEAMGAAGAYLVGGKSIKSAAVGAAAVYLKNMLQNGGVSNSPSGNY